MPSFSSLYKYDWLVGWLVGCLVAWLLDWLIDWLIEGFGSASWATDSCAPSDISAWWTSNNFNIAVRNLPMVIFNIINPGALLVAQMKTILCILWLNKHIRFISLVCLISLLNLKNSLLIVFKTYRSLGPDSVTFPYPHCQYSVKNWNVIYVSSRTGKLISHHIGRFIYL